ncbi:ABC transporter ATP-binding protein [Microbacterium saperdae]|uniref:ABC-2 type transport system ATP-binding protein n=1 Tax=Microbacterium saperdae TaxID=69368 RepID=A0A543BK37_9MICO|nr:ABC transporter ATP-binding protein [Microbacterium saperdae]TQL85133.1 ABC-2 type transport system ATP-binding protein [Microbacterium saperdae]GGM56744.1 ABC transporter ATP-binding protein [Microbacterium saperdae]
MSQPAPAVELSGIVRRFGHGPNRVVAVDRVDLCIERGEVVALLGPNGAGKTTTVDVLLGLSEPDEGTARVLGTDPRHAVAVGRLAAVLQTGGLLSDLTVRETISVVAGLHGVSSRIAEVIERADLGAIARRRVGKCSGGEKQRVKFAIALLPDPDVLVLDEPTAGMDVTARRRFWEAMRADADAGRTILFATHYLEEAEQFARRTVVMNHGRVVADGATARLRASLGGRTVSATVPLSDITELVEELRTDPAVGEVSADADRLTVRTAASDVLAGRLLSLGATDLEIIAPTLESAFTSLTEDRS